MTTPTVEGGWIRGTRCPACNREELFVANGGYITCSASDCPNPDYSEALKTGINTQLNAALVDELTKIHALDEGDTRSLHQVAQAVAVRLEMLTSPTLPPPHPGREIVHGV